MIWKFKCGKAHNTILCRVHLLNLYKGLCVFFRFICCYCRWRCFCVCSWFCCCCCCRCCRCCCCCCVLLVIIDKSVCLLYQLLFRHPTPPTPLFFPSSSVRLSLYLSQSNFVSPLLFVSVSVSICLSLSLTHSLSTYLICLLIYLSIYILSSL